MRRCTLLATLLAASCASESPRRSAPPAAPEARSTSAASEAQPPEPLPAGPSVGPRDDRPRIGSIGYITYVWKDPRRQGVALGYVRAGTSVVRRSKDPVPGSACKAWYAVEPRGYVCHDATTVLDLEDPYYRALASVAPAPGPWPYRYVRSEGAPMYSRVPTPAEADEAEKSYGRKGGAFVTLGNWAHGYEELLGEEPIAATDPVPAWLERHERRAPGGKRNAKTLVWRRAPRGVTLSYARAFEVDGRVWLLTPDLMVVPADRTRAYRTSRFRGVDLGGGVELPLAWNRTKAAKPKWRTTESGALERLDGAFAAKSHLEVEDVPVIVAGRKLLRVRREPGLFVELADVVVTSRRSSLPRGVAPGQKWIEAKILAGTMTMYEGNVPVYATLFSPGKGGVPVPGYDDRRYKTTKVGHFPVEWKDRVATMSMEKGEARILWFSDVGGIQYLRAPMALHVAYWHEDFGNPKSAQCVNVAPEDGAWLLGWTTPVIPPGWGGARPGGGNGEATPVVITAN